MIAGLAAAAVAAPSAAEPAPNSSEQEIVVIGRHEEALRNFVEVMTDPQRYGQIARWYTQVCPTIIGIDPAQADFVARRIGEIAASLDLRARTDGCLTTMLIIVSSNASDLATAFAQRYPITLRTDGRARLKRFVSSTLPIRWLSVTDPCGGGCSLPNSRLTKITNPAFQAMIVIVDAQQIGDFTLGEISDYVSLVALGNPPLTGRRPSSSILSMFDRDRSPGIRYQLTDNDRSLLEGIYRSRGNGSGQEQRGSILRHMRDEEPDKP